MTWAAIVSLLYAAADWQIDRRFGGWSRCLRWYRIQFTRRRRQRPVRPPVDLIPRDTGYLREHVGWHTQEHFYVAAPNRVLGPGLRHSASHVIEELIARRTLAGEIVHVTGWREE